MRRFAFVAGTLIGLLVGASFAGVLCHVSGATNEIFAAQYALFFVYGLLLTGYFGALGYVITRSLVGSQECSEEAATRPHAFSDDPDVVVAEIVEESKPAVPRSSSGLGARIAPWGWLLGWLGILLAGVTAIRRPWSAEIYPLGIAAVVLVLGIILTLACLMAALSDRSRSCTLHAVAGLLVNFVCFVVVAVSGVATVGIDLAQAARRERAAQRQNISARPRFDPSPNRFRIPRAVPQPAPAVRPTLQEAVARNDTKEVERYIKEGAELNEVYRDRQTLLIRAVTRGNRDVVRLLLEHDAGVNGNPDAGLHPISLALDGGQLEIAQMLLQYDPELNVVDIRGYSPLHHCARHGYEELAEDLISRGIPINSQTKDRRTALIVALNERKPRIC
jgi:hypothetical protein